MKHTHSCYRFTIRTLTSYGYGYKKFTGYRNSFPLFLSFSFHGHHGKKLPHLKRNLPRHYKTSYLVKDIVKIPRSISTINNGDTVKIHYESTFHDFRKETKILKRKSPTENNCFTLDPPQACTDVDQDLRIEELQKEIFKEPFNVTDVLFRINDISLQKDTKILLESPAGLSYIWMAIKKSSKSKTLFLARNLREQQTIKKREKEKRQ